MSSILPIIRFEKQGHKYTTRCGTILTSVNGLLKEYEPPFEGDYWLTQSAIEKQLPEWKTLRKEKFGHWKPSLQRVFTEINDVINYEKLQEDISIIESEWDAERERASIEGTAFHDAQEALDYERGYRVNPWDNKKYPIFTINKEYDNQTVIDDLFYLEDGYHAELLVYWGPICGQADMVYIETIDGVRYIDIDDHKGLALDTPIATINGWSTMGDISEGDIVFDGNGQPTEVTVVSNIHYNPCYKITFQNGDTLIADHEHKWVLENDIEKIEVTTENLYKYEDYLIINPHITIDTLDDIDYNCELINTSLNRPCIYTIKSIEKVDTVPTKCIAVKSEDHTYLAGRNLIKTHNTNKKIKGGIFSTFKSPIDHVYSNHKTKYGLAISMYAYILEKWGFEVRNLAFTHYKKYDPETAKMYPINYMRKEVHSIYPQVSKPDVFTR